MSKPTDRDLDVPPTLRDEHLEIGEACARLRSWNHPRPRRWLDRMLEEGRLPPAPLPMAGIWRELLADECDKLYNQAWCALEQIENAEDETTVMMLAIDDLPSAVEQAFCLAPSLAGEHLDLLERYKEEKYEAFLRELAVGTDREDRERVECLAFWEENAPSLSDLRRTLYRLVREEILRRSEEPRPAPEKHTWTPRPFDPRTAPRDLWKRFHEYCRARHVETALEGDPVADQVREDYLQGPLGKRLEILYVEEGSRIAGICCLRRPRSAGPENDEDRVLRLSAGMLREFRPCGLGEKWLRVALEEMDRTGIRILQANSSEPDQARFLEEMGFVAESTESHRRLDLSKVGFSRVLDDVSHRIGRDDLAARLAEHPPPAAG